MFAHYCLCYVCVRVTNARSGAHNMFTQSRVSALNVGQIMQALEEVGDMQAGKETILTLQGMAATSRHVTYIREESHV